ncbi:MAG: type II secretion system F family protein [Alphaproteobacteria bacterium]
MTMQPGQPVQLSAFLPRGMSFDDVLVAAAALAVFLIVWAIGQGFVERDRLGPRLKAIAERRAELKGELTTARRRSKRQSGNASSIGMMRQVVQQLKVFKDHQLVAIQGKLIQAGYRSKDAIFVFGFAKLVAPFAGLGLGVLASGIDWSNPFTLDEATDWLILIGLGLITARLPDILLSNARSRRYHAIRKGLPDALDLMMICAEAGLSLAAALDRVSRELGRVNPELAEEFSLTSVELGFLPERAVALRHLGERCDIKEVRGFVNVIAQTEKYGTPISQALRVLAREYRTERMLRAEAKAARLPALMTVPMIVFILPTLFVIIMAPAVINIMDSMK